MIDFIGSPGRARTADLVINSLTFYRENSDTYDLLFSQKQSYNPLICMGRGHLFSQRQNP